ncbi:MAG: nitrilase-related carbon-nitrogen hydrolase [Steroidobacteraceae bacterium]
MNSQPVAPQVGRSPVRPLIDANVARAVEAIDRACSGPHPPALVVLPEFAFQGPPHGVPISDWIEHACDSLPGRATGPLQSLAAKRGVFIAGNLFERDDRWPGRFFNTSFLIDDRGEVILRYRRVNTALWPSPHDFLDEYVAEYGIEGIFPVADTPLGRLAVIPCGEIAVPEVSRAFMLRGAEVLLHPTNEEYSPGQEAAKIARAAENMVYVISANVAGPIGFSLDGSILGGRSRIVDYRGKTLALDSGAGESVETAAVIDIRALRAARRDTGLANTILRSRWEIYRPLFDSAKTYPPNRFLGRPMTDSAATRSVSAAALSNLVEAGIVVPEPAHFE